jgi:hypothetical protein
MHDSLVPLLLCIACILSVVDDSFAARLMLTCGLLHPAHTATDCTARLHYTQGLNSHYEHYMLREVT